MIYTLGLGDALCGVTSECDFPPDARRKPMVVEGVEMLGAMLHPDRPDWSAPSSSALRVPPPGTRA